jgi:hypothetical protein
MPTFWEGLAIVLLIYISWQLHGVGSTLESILAEIKSK